jgi:hypothetical protein
LLSLSLAKDGEKEQKVGTMVYESKKHLPTIESDLAHNSECILQTYHAPPLRE